MIYLNGNVYWLNAVQRKLLNVGHMECDEQDLPNGDREEPIFNRKHCLVIRDREVGGIYLYSPEYSREIDAGVGCCPRIITFDDDFIYYEGCSGFRSKIDLESLDVISLPSDGSVGE